MKFMFKQDNTIKPEFFTLADLFEIQKEERQERLEKGVKKGDFHVYFRRHDLTIQIERNGCYYYEIDLEQCKTSSDLLDWIFQIRNKTWVESSSLLDIVMTVFDDACYAVYGQDAQTLLISDKTLNWKNHKLVNE